MNAFFDERNYNSGRLETCETLPVNPVERLELCNPLSSSRDLDYSFVTWLPTGKYVVKKKVNNQLDYVKNKVSFSTMQA